MTPHRETVRGESVRGVTVDLDDTLFPQAEWLAGAWRAVADRAGQLGLDGVALLPHLRRLAAEGTDGGDIIDRALACIGQPPDAHVAALVAAFTAHSPARLTPYPGAGPALAALARRLPVVCITDGNPRIQRAKLAALGLEDAFDHVVISDELGGRGLRKPHPAPFRRALELLALDPGQVVHVGDRPAKDVLGATGAGIRSVRVRTGEYAGVPDQEGLHPWRTVATFAEAVDLCLTAAGGVRPPPAWEQTECLARL